MKHQNFDSVLKWNFKCQLFNFQQIFRFRSLLLLVIETLKKFINKCFKLERFLDLTLFILSRIFEAPGVFSNC